MVRRVILLSALCALAVGLASCGQSKVEDTADPVAKTATAPPASDAKESPSYRIALVMKAGSNPFFAAMEAGAVEAGKELGVEVLPRTITDESQDQQQIDIVDAMIVDQVDAILIAPANSKSLVQPLLRAQEAGIPIINVDNRLDGAAMEQAGLELLAYIGADNEAGGLLAGRHLCELLGGAGKVAMLEGRRGVDNAEARKRGFEAACAEYPDIQIVVSEAADWELQIAQDKFAGIMVAHPEIQGLFCANDNMALGALAAMDEAGKLADIKVVSYDNIQAAQDAIKAGRLAATIEQNPGQMGAEAVRAAVAHLNGEAVEAEILVALEVITAESLAD
ncbi:MAG: sugar ABC transporter substrate-binding protein [candidate division WS1 bacterium]|jgi:ribose transport system substrate-binding protein|nr:sugar ABC transporter substrate-binding protein [candidate division WS1 bacterium]